VHNDNLIIFGGKTQKKYSNNLFQNSRYTNSRGTSTHRQWILIQTTKPPPPCYGHTAVIHDNVMFVYGGRSEDGAVLNDLYKYDIQENEWHSSSFGQEGRYHHSACMHGNMMYISGGRDDKTIFNDVFCVNLDTLKVEKLPPLPNARYGHVSYYNDGLYVYGGCDAKQDFNRGGWRFNLTWEPVDHSPLLHGCVHATVVYHETFGARFDGGTTVHHKLSLQALSEYQDDVFMIILPYLPVRELCCIIRTSKHWSVAKLATSK
jgi:hypothetical protein